MDLAEFWLNVHDEPDPPPGRWPYPSQFPRDEPILGIEGGSGSLHFRGSANLPLRLADDVVETRLQTRMLVSADRTTSLFDPDQPWQDKSFESRTEAGLAMWIDDVVGLTNGLVNRALNTLLRLVQQRGGIQAFVEIRDGDIHRGNILLNFPKR